MIDVWNITTNFLVVFNFHLPMATHKGTVILAFTFHGQTDSMSCVYLNINIYSSHRSHIQTKQRSGQCEESM